MTVTNDTAVQRAITTIAQSDPLIKLLQQVTLGRMKPTDAGLRAVTDSWLKTYQNVLETTPLDRAALLRLDPRPRLAVLQEAGILSLDNEAACSLQASFVHQLGNA